MNKYIIRINHGVYDDSQDFDEYYDNSKFYLKGYIFFNGEWVYYEKFGKNEFYFKDDTLIKCNIPNLIDKPLSVTVEYEDFTYEDILNKHSIPEGVIVDYYY